MARRLQHERPQRHARRGRRSSDSSGSRRQDSTMPPCWRGHEILRPHENQLSLFLGSADAQHRIAPSWPAARHGVAGLALPPNQRGTECTENISSARPLGISNCETVFWGLRHVPTCGPAAIRSDVNQKRNGFGTAAFAVSTEHRCLASTRTLKHKRSACRPWRAVVRLMARPVGAAPDRKCSGGCDEWH